MIANTMIVLGIDSSTDFLSAAVCTEEGTRAEFTFDAGRSHAERIIETIERVLHDAALALPDVDLLAVAHGPGSFTGVRIGVATLKGLALGAGKPLVGVSTLRAMARAAGNDTACVCPLIDARMDEVFGAIYRREAASWINVSPERVGPIEALVNNLPEDAVVCGDGASRYADRLRAAAPRARVLSAEQGRPSGAAVAMEGLAAYRDGDTGDPARVQPVYLRQSQPEEIRRRRAEASAKARA